MKIFQFIFTLALIALTSCMGNSITTPDSGSSNVEIWDLVSSGCGATIYSAPSGGPALRLSIRDSSSVARVSLATFPPVVCNTQQTVSYPASGLIRFVDGDISCATSSSSDLYPWNDGPDDVTFQFSKGISYLILSKPPGDAGCNSQQTFNYVFEKSQ